jgi:hypothetical protein
MTPVAMLKNNLFAIMHARIQKNSKLYTLYTFFRLSHKDLPIILLYFLLNFKYIKQTFCSLKYPMEDIIHINSQKNRNFRYTYKITEAIPKLIQSNEITSK